MSHFKSMSFTAMFAYQKWAIPCLLYLYFLLFNTDLIQLIVNKICLWLDLSCVSLVLETTALPTVPQPLPSREDKLFYKIQLLQSGSLSLR